MQTTQYTVEEIIRMKQFLKSFNANKKKIKSYQRYIKGLEIKLVELDGQSNYKIMKFVLDDIKYNLNIVLRNNYDIICNYIDSKDDYNIGNLSNLLGQTINYY